MKRPLLILKRESKDALIAVALEVAGAVQAYASTSANRTLFEEVGYSKTELEAPHV